MASPGPAPACAVDGVRVRRRPRILLPRSRSQLDILTPLVDSREPLSRTWLPAVPSLVHGRGRCPPLPAVQPLPNRWLLHYQAGHPARFRRLVRADLCSKSPHAAVLHHCRGSRISVTLPPHIQPMDRTDGNTAVVLVVLPALLQRHDRQRGHVRPLRSDVNLSRYGRLRAGRPLPSADRQDVHRPAVGLARLGSAAAVRHHWVGERTPADAFCLRNFYPPPVMSS